MKILGWLKKGLLTLFKFYMAGWGETILVIAVVAIISLIISFAKPINGFLAQFIPEQYLFPQAGIVLILILPLIFNILTKIGIKKFLKRLLGKVPFLSFFFGKEGIQEGIPVAVKEGNSLAYGFLRGRTEIYDDTGFVKNGYSTWLAVFSPSSPFPASAMLPKDYRPEDVREVEIIDQEGRNFARLAIIRKCVNFGESLGKIRLKVIEEEEVKKLPILSEKDKEKIAQKLKKEVESAK